MEDGKTLREVEEEITKIDDYCRYLYSFKECLCELFGHDVNSRDSCNCCEHTISDNGYIISHEKAKYRGVVSYKKYLHEKNYMISLTAEMKKEIPTHDSYPKQ